MFKRSILIALLAMFGLALAQDEAVTFTVTIENVSDNADADPVPLSPGIYVIHSGINPVFTPGRLDRGEGLEALAEDGNPSVLAETLNASEDATLSTVGVFDTPVGSDAPGPIAPGESYEFSFDATPGDALTLATMYIPSNDIFIAPAGQGIPLFGADDEPIDSDVSSAFAHWDAGTEFNQEPGAGSDQAPRQAGADTGDAESEVVSRVDSDAAPDEDATETVDEAGVTVVEGEDEDDTYTYEAIEQIIRITIQPSN